jgi:hypothetical protein
MQAADSFELSLIVEHPEERPARYDVYLGREIIFSGASEGEANAFRAGWKERLETLRSVDFVDLITGVLRSGKVDREDIQGIGVNVTFAAEVMKRLLYPEAE